MLVRTRRVTREVAFAPDSSPPPDLDQDHIDDADARLMIDGSPLVREKAQRCYRTATRFWTSYTMRAVITVDEHGVYHYQWNRTLTEDQRVLALSMSLGEVHEELSAAIDALAREIRRELHGRTGA
jgi:hypothetical protein